MDEPDVIVIAIPRPLEDIRLLPLRKMAHALWLRPGIASAFNAEYEIYELLISQLEAD